MNMLWIFLMSAAIYATPKYLTVSFVDSKDLASFLRVKKYAPVAKNVFELKCQKMGEYCFDPQVGLYKPGEEDKAAKLKESSETDVSLKKVRGLGADGFFNTSLINCDKSNRYDIYCNGKSAKKSQTVASKTSKKHEIWIDGSSGMKAFDSSKLEPSCKRADFLSLLNSTCVNSNKFNVFSISSIKKQIGTSGQACQNAEDKIQIEKLISWITTSKVNRLDIFLDDYYAQGKFMAFLKTRSNIKINGLKTKINLSQMSNEVNRLKKYCN